MEIAQRHLHYETRQKSIFSSKSSPHLSSLEKVAERVIWKLLAEIVNERSILFDEQCGFRGHHSSSDQLLRVVAEWSQFTGAVFLDVAKPFDGVRHEELVGFAIDRITVVEGEQPQTGSPKLRLCYNAPGVPSCRSVSPPTVRLQRTISGHLHV